MDSIGKFIELLFLLLSVQNDKKKGHTMNTTNSSTLTGINTDNNLRSSPSLPPRIAPELEDFYNSHNVDLTSILNWKKTSSSSSSSSSSSALLLFPYRFIRLNPRYDEKETLMILEKEMKEKEENTTRQSATTPIEVSWVGREWKFFAIPSNFPLSTSKSFSSGRIYGMDVSSGAAIAALFSDSSCLSDTNQEKEEVKIDATIKDNNNDDNATHVTTTSTTTRPPGATTNVRILDLCCCPGLKLCAMADFWETKQQQQQQQQQQHHHDSACTTTTTTIVGVDVSENRMALCKKIVQKYHINKETSGICNNMKERINQNNTNIQLFCQDGTTFGMNTKDDNLVFDSRAAIEEVNSREDIGGGGSKRKRMNKSARAREKKRLKQFASENWQQQQVEEENNDNVHQRQPQMKPFDYVLVDAECSTDGSLKHLRERLLKKKKGMTPPTTTVPVTGDDVVEEKQEEEESNNILTDKRKLADLLDLQQRLLYSAFRLLKRGGMLVYSTCSLSCDQNEGVVNWLLSQQKDAYLIPVEFPETAAGNNNKLVISGSLPGTLRFYPNLIGQQQADCDTSPSSLGGLYGDGFFVAKIGKRSLGDMNNV